jgi:hypothetical protein
MLSLIVLKEFLDTKTGRMAALCVVGCVAFAIWLFAHDRKVTAKAVMKIEKQDATNVKKAQAAGARSRDPRTSGVLDPYQRPDD